MSAKPHKFFDHTREAVTPRSEVRGDGPIGGEKTLRVPRGLESPHAALSLAGRLVRILGTVVQRPVLPMLYMGQDLTQRRTIAFQLIRNDHPRRIG